MKLTEMEEDSSASSLAQLEDMLDKLSMDIMNHDQKSPSALSEETRTFWDQVRALQRVQSSMPAVCPPTQPAKRADLAFW